MQTHTQTQANPFPFNMRRRMVEDDEYVIYDNNDRKCVLLGNIDGLQELCITNDYIDIKKYLKREIKGIVMMRWKLRW